MPYTVERLPGEPIILLTFTKPYDTEQAKMASAEVNLIMQNETEKFYRVSDVSQLDNDPRDVVTGFSHHRQLADGSVTDPRLIPVVVGGGMSGVILARSLNVSTQGKVEVLLYDTVEEALSDIRDRIRREENRHSEA